MREAEEILFHSYLASAPERGERLASRSDNFTPKKSPKYVLEMRLVGLQSRFRRPGLEKNSYACGKSNHISSIIKPVAKALFRSIEATKNYQTRINFNTIHLLSCRRLISRLLNDSI
jgi:hypothetical protein